MFRADIYGLGDRTARCSTARSARSSSRWPGASSCSTPAAGTLLWVALIAGAIGGAVRRVHALARVPDLARAAFVHISRHSRDAVSARRCRACPASRDASGQASRRARRAPAARRGGRRRAVAGGARRPGAVVLGGGGARGRARPGRRRRPAAARPAARCPGAFAAALRVREADDGVRVAVRVPLVLDRRCAWPPCRRPRRSFRRSDDGRAASAGRRRSSSWRCCRCWSPSACAAAQLLAAGAARELAGHAAEAGRSRCCRAATRLPPRARGAGLVARRGWRSRCAAEPCTSRSVPSRSSPPLADAPDRPLGREDAARDRRRAPRPALRRARRPRSGRTSAGCAPAELAGAARGAAARRCAVLCAARDARVAGGAAALALAHHAGAPAVARRWSGRARAHAAPDAPGRARGAPPGDGLPAAPSRRGRLPRGRRSSRGARGRRRRAGAALLDAPRARRPRRRRPARRGDATRWRRAGPRRCVVVAAGDADRGRGARPRPLRATALVTLPTSPGAAALARAGHGAGRPAAAGVPGGARVRRGERGQALLLLVGGAGRGPASARCVLGAIAAASARGPTTSAPPTSARCPGAKAMRDAYDRLFAPPLIDGRPNPDRLERAAYLALGARGGARDGREATAPSDVAVTFPAADRCRADADPRDGRTTASPGRRGDARARGGRARAARGRRRRRAPARASTPARSPTARASRCAPTSPQAFDRMAAAARGRRRRADRRQRLSQRRRAGGPLRRATRTRSGSRGRAPRCTGSAPSSTSARRRPTAGWPPTPPRFHFVQRYSWEPWHYGFTLNAGSTLGGLRRRGRRGGRRARLRARRGSPRCSPRPRSAGTSRRRCSPRRPPRSRASTRSRARRRGRRASRSSCRAPPRPTGCATRSTPAQAIDAQAHMMRDLLRQFASVPLALAAYNAGPARVGACMCIPPYPRDPGLRRRDPRDAQRDGRLHRPARRRVGDPAGGLAERHGSRSSSCETSFVNRGRCVGGSEP